MRPQLLRLNADVLVLQEVNGQETSGKPRQLLALQELLESTPYAGHQVATTLTKKGEPYDERNLVVLSRFPIKRVESLRDNEMPPLYRKVTANPPEANAKPVEWERPILHVQLDIGSGRIFHVFNIHLKSRLPTTIEGQKKDQYTWNTARGWAEGYFISSMKRVGQALEARLYIDQVFDSDPKAWIAVCGDFNADSDEVPVTAIRGPVEETGNPALSNRVLIPCENTIPQSSRWTLLHLGHGEMLDHILVSRTMLSVYRGAEIHNENVPDESGAFRTDVLFPESDHAPIVAEFEIP